MLPYPDDFHNVGSTRDTVKVAFGDDDQIIVAHRAAPLKFFNHLDVCLTRIDPGLEIEADRINPLNSVTFLRVATCPVKA